MTNTRSETYRKLRLRAEEKVRIDGWLPAKNPQTPETMEQTLHELEMHQIELEMQNDELRRTQHELIASRASYFDLYDLAPFGYLTFSETGLILKSNLAASTMFGVGRNVLSQSVMSQFIFPEDQDFYYLQRKRVIETGELQTWEMRLRRADGSPFWANLQVTPVHNGEYWISLNEVTERRQAEKALLESEKFTSDLIDSLTYSIAVLDSNGNIVAVNEAWRRFARENGAPADISFYVGKYYMSVCNANYNCVDEGYKAAFIGINAVLKGEMDHFSMEYPCHSPDEPRWFSMNVSRFTGSRQYSIISHTNITEHKKSEEALMRANIQI